MLKSFYFSIILNGIKLYEMYNSNVYNYIGVFYFEKKYDFDHRYVNKENIDNACFI